MYLEKKLPGRTYLHKCNNHQYPLVQLASSYYCHVRKKQKHVIFLNFHPSPALLWILQL